MTMRHAGVALVREIIIIENVAQISDGALWLHGVESSKQTDLCPTVSEEATWLRNVSTHACDFASLCILESLAGEMLC